ncbi:MAG: T9SS type A sorting domain-containing protein [Ferruginibacter sp.]
MKLMRSALGCLFIFLWNTVPAQTHTAKPGVVTCPISNGYYEYLPEGYWNNASETFPLIVFIPGLGELGNGTTDLWKVLSYGPTNQIASGTFPTSFSVNGQTYRFIVITPQFTANPWTGHFNTFLDYVVSHYKVDINRIYLSGFSMGGGTCWAYAGENSTYANRIAAIVPTAGAWQPSLSICQTMAAANLPILAFHNSGDNIVPAYWTDFFVDNTNQVSLPPNPPAKKIIFNSNSHSTGEAFSLTLNNNNQYGFPGNNVYEWMLQFRRFFTTLPVELNGFSAVKQNGKTFLQWQTSNETNSRGFEIQRSSNTQNWTNIAFVNSAGTAAGNYSFTDASPASGKNYYRIRQVDISGAYKLSEIKWVDFSRKFSLGISPNPVVNTININTDAVLNNAWLEIYNAQGQLVLQSKLNGNGNISIPAQKLIKGNYVANISVDGFKEQIKFIKE